MKIGDLWVKLGLKKDEFSKGMKQADGEVSSLTGKMKSMSAIGAAAWAAVSAAVVKFAKDAISMTQKWGDAWNQTMAGIKGAYSSFVRQISSGEGWNNLFANMREAYRVSKEVAAALDEIFERKTSFSYQEADTDRQIAQLQLIARDSSKSDAERIAANKKIIELTNQLGESKKQIYTDEAANQRRLFQLQTGLNDEQTDFLVKEYNQNRENIKQAREYLRLKKELTSVGGAGFFTESVGPIPSPVASGQRVSPELERLERETPQAIKDIAELTKMYDKSNDALVKGMADAEVAVIRIDTETMHAQTRATSLLGTLTKATSSMQVADDSLDKTVEKIQKSLQEKLKDVSLEIEIEDVQLDWETDDFFQYNLDQLMAGLERAAEFAQELRETIAGGVSDAIQELANQFAGLEDINPGKVAQALLTPLADMAIKEGELLVATGIGVEACKEALTSLQGPAAIAAGLTLMALGAAAKSGLAAIAKSGGSSTATTSYGSAGASAAQTQTIQTEMTVYVTGRLSGSDILLSGQKTQNNWNR